MNVTSNALATQTVLYIKQHYGNLLPSQYDLIINFIKLMMRKSGFDNDIIEQVIVDIMRETINHA